MEREKEVSRGPAWRPRVIRNQDILCGDEALWTLPPGPTRWLPGSEDFEPRRTVLSKSGESSVTLQHSPTCHPTPAQAHLPKYVWQRPNFRDPTIHTKTERHPQTTSVLGFHKETRHHLTSGAETDTNMQDDQHRTPRLICLLQQVLFPHSTDGKTEA